MKDTDAKTISYFKINKKGFFESWTKEVVLYGHIKKNGVMVITRELYSPLSRRNKKS